MNIEERTNYLGQIKMAISNLEANGYSWQIYIYRNGKRYKNTEYTIETLSEIKNDETAILEVWRGKLPSSNPVTAKYGVKQKLKYIENIKVIVSNDKELDDVDGLINNPIGEQLSFF